MRARSCIGQTWSSRTIPNDARPIVRSSRTMKPIGLGLMIQINQTLASLSFLANLLTIFALYIDSQYVSKLLFGVVLGLLMLAIILFMIEIGIATKSLNLHLSDLDGND